MKPPRFTIIGWTCFLLVISLACSLPAVFQIPGSSPISTREAHRTQTADECDLSAFLGARIEVTQKETNQFGTRLCTFEVYYENQSQESAYPILYKHSLDCYSGEDSYSWRSPQILGPGEEGSWPGTHHLYTDPDCVGGEFWEKIVSAALILDADQCRDRLGDEDYYQSIAVPIYLDCPAGE